MFGCQQETNLREEFLVRFVWLSVGLAALLLIVFFIWKDTFDAMFSHDAMVAWLQANQAWGWIAGIGLLISDLLLPIPTTIVMSALGYVYGPVVGGLVSATGSFLAGMLAYLACRKIGKRAALWLVGEKDLARGERLFERSGGWIVALSRSLPLLSEVVACLAGLSRMPLRRFALALACGSVPMGFVFAWIGSLGEDWPGLAMGLSLAIPALLWLIAGKFFRSGSPGKRKESGAGADLG